MYKGVIYCFENKINNKKYIGLTLNEAQRKKEHLSLRSDCPYFKKALYKYGVNNFKYLILFEIVLDNKFEILNILKQKEIEYILSYKSNNRNYGYNLTNGGQGTLGYKRIVSEETKQKISNTMKGRKNNFIFTKEQKIKIAENISKFSKEDISNIKKLCSNNKQSYVASLYNVNKSTISRIINSKSWAHHI